MDLALNETQLMLQSMAREFLSNEVPKTAVRAIDESATGFSAELWQKITDLGWAGMGVAEEHGGTGNSLADLASVFEASAAQLAEVVVVDDASNDGTTALIELWARPLGMSRHL